ncbi:hypothetical protein BGZ76_007759 [Entomortierella beljakovae]|nr:hypothetical protein BGZ76_007759 [Entomortierella beljakovae]
MATLSHSSNTSQVAEALLNRARRLSNNAYERSCPPSSSFAESESHRSSHLTSFNHTHWNNTRRSPSGHLRLNSTNNDSYSQSLSNPLILESTTSEVSKLPTLIETPSIISTTFLEKGSVTVEGPAETVSESLSRTSSIKNSLLDPSRTQTIPCTTSRSTHLTTNLLSRPRALTLECIHEVRDPRTDNTLVKQTPPRDLHRKHLSENGKSLVYGVLAALRQNTELESSSLLNKTDRSDESSISLKMVSDIDHTTDSMENMSAENDNHDLRAEVISPSATVEKAPSTPVTDTASISTLETSKSEGTSLTVLDETEEPSTLNCGNTTEASCTMKADSDHESDDGLLILVPETKFVAEPHTSMVSSSIKSAGTSEHEKKEGKGAFLLHKMGMRKNSFTESSSAKDSFDTGTIKSLASSLSARPSFTKGTKRSSRLLGKFVHKILPNSLSHNNSTSTASPQVHSAGLSPLSTRPSRSASMASQNNQVMYSVEEAATIALPMSTTASSKGSMESLPLESSIYRDETSSMTSNQSEADKDEKIHKTCNFEVEYGEEEVDENDYESSENDEIMSPYVIDDDCDDEFFLNSVLRKKSYPTLNMAPERPPVMSSSYPSNTTLDSEHSTPSLSGWSSSSSQASTPSPTSPSFPNNQTYPFPLSTTKSQHIHYRSNPLPLPVHSGLDEKRARLRDAVSEWRRSADVSLS